MTLEKLLDGLKVLSTNVNLEKDIKDIKINSQTVEDGDIFVSMKGLKDDGNKYLDQIKKDFVAITEIKPQNQEYLFQYSQEQTVNMTQLKHLKMLEEKHLLQYLKT